MKKIVEKYAELPTVIRKPLWKFWHKLLIRYDKKTEAVFMNYGFEDGETEERPVLEVTDEINRYCIQLYHHVVQSLDITGLDVLEVGSGRGGGAAYIARYFNPRKYTGLDISGEVVSFCNKNFSDIDNLHFHKGVAENLPFEDESYDVLVNVESARCYTSIPRFFKEAHRVLRQGGHFLFADMIKKDEIDEIVTNLKEQNFEIISSRDITANVIKSLDIDHQRRLKLITERLPSFMHKSFAEFAGTKGSGRYNSFANGKIQYWSFVLKKK